MGIHKAPTRRNPHSSVFITDTYHYKYNNRAAYVTLGAHDL